jgi:hypothetical protein
MRLGMVSMFPIFVLVGPVTVMMNRVKGAQDINRKNWRQYDDRPRGYHIGRRWIIHISFSTWNPKSTQMNMDVASPCRYDES